MKCQKLLSKKKFYKQKFLKLNKSFKNFKLEFLNISSLNEKITLDLKASLSLKDNFDKTKKENDLLSKEILELRKETLDHLLDSQRSHGLKHGLDFFNGASTSSSLSKFVEATLTSSFISCESFKPQDSKTKSLINPSANGKPLKANIS